MSKRLAQMTEETLETGGSGAKKAVAEAGFDEELRKRLEERIATASTRNEYPEAFARAELPTHASQGSADIALATPWTGNEVMEDTALRMLNDASKPMKITGRATAPPLAPRAPSRKVSPGTRLANAKDRSFLYSNLKDNGRSDKERQQYFNEVKARFQPEARAVPATLTGLASLANERIEDAIARGQFKNLPRGKQIERDYNASSPFIDTTEYLLNKMIQKQEIVPPWIEKQKELVTTVRRFRLRLRNDWMRHAARVVASAGGSLQEQVRRAEEYAAAEVAEVDPKPTEGGKRPQFRDAAWESAELAFHTLSISSMNSLTRSYNLIAPQLAQKPYYNLKRELKACFAEVAPLVGPEIRRRASAPKQIKGFSAAAGNTSPGILDRVNSSKVKVHDEDYKKKGYGFKQFWADVLGRK